MRGSGETHGVDQMSTFFKIMLTFDQQSLTRANEVIVVAHKQNQRFRAATKISAKRVTVGFSNNSNFSFLMMTTAKIKTHIVILDAALPSV